MNGVLYLLVRPEVDKDFCGGDSINESKVLDPKSETNPVSVVYGFL